MKQMETFHRILKVLFLLRDMPSGAGWATPQEIINYSGVSHSTVYRNLPKLETLGFLHVEEYTCRKLKCRRYRITVTGDGFLDSWNEMPLK